MIDRIKTRIVRLFALIEAWEIEHLPPVKVWVHEQPARIQRWAVKARKWVDRYRRARHYFYELTYLRYPEGTRRQLRNYKTEGGRTRRNSEHMRVAEQLAAAFPESAYHTSYTDYMGRADVSFKIDDTDVITSVATWLRQHGYQIKKMIDSAEYKQRSYEYIPLGAKDSDFYYGALNIRYSFDASDNARCKYVEIGTKVTEAKSESVFELQCDDQAVDEPEPVTA